MQKIAFFDFDGTITTKDTMLEVIKYQKGKAGFYTGFLLNAPTLISLKLKFISNQKAKETILKYFFSGTELNTFQLACDEFAIKVLPSLIRRGAIGEIDKLKKEGFVVVIVSASAENWLSEWCADNDIKLIGSRLEIKEGKVTGMLIGINCHGHEKTVRIKAEYNLSEYDEIYAYGDTGGDKPMMALATKSFYKPFRN